mmetsp:Transcript_5348/g.12806  ORF Transcript_5348/g.12806 Transcript_5348/m.12806 type:complete len:367 (-) Transcript_5348:78-1178(-)
MAAARGGWLAGVGLIHVVVIVTNGSSGNSRRSSRSRIGALHPLAQLGQVAPEQRVVERPGVRPAGDLAEPPPVQLAGERRVLGRGREALDPGPLPLGRRGRGRSGLRSGSSRSSRSSSRSARGTTAGRGGALGKIQRQHVVGKHLGLEDDEGLAVREPRDDPGNGGVGQHPEEAVGEVLPGRLLRLVMLRGVLREIIGASRCTAGGGPDGLPPPTPPPLLALGGGGSGDLTAVEAFGDATRNSGLALRELGWRGSRRTGGGGRRRCARSDGIGDRIGSKTPGRWRGRRIGRHRRSAATEGEEHTGRRGKAVGRIGRGGGSRSGRSSSCCCDSSGRCAVECGANEAITTVDCAESVGRRRRGLVLAA